MPPFRTVPLSAALVAEVRATRRAPRYGHPAHAEIATGDGPCRLCLHTFRQGDERRLLFTFDPFDGLDPYPAPGPVFVHEDECVPFDAPSGFPDSLRPLPLTLEAYDGERLIVGRERVSDGMVEPAASRLWADGRTKYIHVRNTEAGCYIARLERIGSPGVPARLE